MPVPRREPIFNVPAIILAMLGVLVALHLARQGLTEPDDDRLVLALAFIPDRYGAHPLHWPGGALSTWASPLTHMAVHGDAMHLGLNGASLAAFGGLIARRLGSARFLAFTLICGLAGAALFLVVDWGGKAPMIGASGAIAGMMAAALRLLFSAVDTAPAGRAGDLIRGAPERVALARLPQALRDRRLQTATGIWLLINVLAAFGLATPGQAGIIAWEAHIGGFFAGVLLLDLLDPGPRQNAHHETRPADRSEDASIS